MTTLTPPKSDELEISVFGPGRGECIVVHLGSGKWMIVDSCILPGSTRPIALEYLDKLNVDVSRNVVLVGATHWDDDHIRGLADVLRASKAAKFTCSAALEGEQFLALVNYAPEVRDSGVQEFYEILRVLADRKAGASSSSKRRWGPDLWASGVTRLYRGLEFDQVDVDALSPSAQTISDQLGEIAKLHPIPGEPIRRFMSNGPNDLSVVLLIQAPEYSVLLGADLEIGKGEERGWRAILKSTTRPPRRSHFYKVAHHGSSTADLAGIWTDLLVARPVVAMTPFVWGRTKLPNAEDMKRFKRVAGEIYCTVWPISTKPKQRNPDVDQMMRWATSARRAVSKGCGHVRLRSDIKGLPTTMAVDAFNGAKRVYP